MARRGTAASINLGELEKLAALQCTDEEMAGWFGISTRTIERRRKSRIFAETIERGRSKGRISLRRSQLKILQDGSATMGIWLGKQYLGQTDEMNINTNAQIAMVVIQTAVAPKDMPTDTIVNPPTVIDTRAESERRLLE